MPRPPALVGDAFPAWSPASHRPGLRPFRSRQLLGSLSCSRRPPCLCVAQMALRALEMWTGWQWAGRFQMGEEGSRGPAAARFGLTPSLPPQAFRVSPGFSTGLLGKNEVRVGSSGHSRPLSQRGCGGRDAENVGPTRAGPQSVSRLSWAGVRAKCSLGRVPRVRASPLGSGLRWVPEAPDRTGAPVPSPFPL